MMHSPALLAAEPLVPFPTWLEPTAERFNAFYVDWLKPVADWLDSWLPGTSKALACPTFWALAFAAIGLYLLIPTGKYSGGKHRVGWIAIALSGLLFAADLPRFGGWGEQIAFWLLAAGTLGSGVAMIASRSAVYSALWFALSLVGTAGIFLVQGAQFLGGATIVVYAGAIVVTFLFVLMLAQPEGHSTYDRLSWGWFPKPTAVIAAAALVGLLISLMGNLKHEARHGDLISVEADEQILAEGVLDHRHMAKLGRAMFTQQLIAVEIAGSLLTAALVGAVAIAIHGKQAVRGAED